MANENRSSRHSGKRVIKEEIYNKLPVGWRGVLYFFYRYFGLFGFLDGSKGFLYHFLQGFWYRLLVDIKVMDVILLLGRYRKDQDYLKEITMG